MTQARYAIDPLTKFAHDLLAAGGMEQPKAEAVSRLLVLTDMIGRPTHGVALVPRYVEQLEKGLMEGKGEPDSLTDKGATLVWDGRYLPGPWLVERALALAFERLPEHGVVTLSISRSQ